MNESFNAKTNVLRDTVLQRKQLVIGANLIFLANNSKSRQFSPNCGDKRF